MAKVCEICGKRPQKGHTVSHANNKTRRRWYPNLKRVRTVREGRPMRIRVCTSCIKSGYVVKVAS